MQSNTLVPGDIVSMVHRNGSGEGVLWRVQRLVGTTRVRIIPIFTATGGSVLNPKTIDYRSVERLSLSDMCFVRNELDRIIQGYVKFMSGACSLEELENDWSEGPIEQPASDENPPEGGLETVQEPHEPVVG